MEITMPKTKEQQDFEINVQYLINVLSDLSSKEVKQVIDFAVFLANE